MAVQLVMMVPKLLCVYWWAQTYFHHYEQKWYVFLLNQGFFLRGKCLCMLSSHFWIKTPYWAPRHGKVDRWNDLDSESITWRSATLDCCEEEVNDFYVWAFLYLGIYLLLQLRLSWLNNGSGLTQHSSKNGLEKSEIS